MPGKMVSPARSLAIKLSRSSSLTLRVRSLCSENALLRSSPRVQGRFMRGPLGEIIRSGEQFSIVGLLRVGSCLKVLERRLRGPRWLRSAVFGGVRALFWKTEFEDCFRSAARARAMLARELIKEKR